MGKEKLMGKHAALPRHRVGRLVAIASIVVASMLVLAYLTGVLVFSRLVFLPGTRVNGEDVSLRPASEVAAGHSERASDYELLVSGQGLDLVVPSTNIDLAVDGTAYVTDALAQANAWLWPYLAFQRRDLVVVTSAIYDEGKAARLVGSAVDALNETATPPIDAAVTLDAETGRYVVAGGEPGTQLDSEAVETVVFEALDAMDASVEITERQLALPEVTIDDEALKAEAETLNRFADATQTLVVGGNEVGSVDGTQISQWIVTREDASLGIDGAAVTEWARGPLSEQLDSAGSTRSYTRPDGKAIQVSGGTYGWSIDGAALAAQIVANVEAGTPATIEVPMLQTAASWSPGGADWGARYVDIDISEQYVRFYGDDGALVWESSCVTGDSSQGHDTPTGVYSVNGNMASGNVELRGKIDPATNEPEYISHVAYWMPFIENAVALHDADWRSSFGGTIYQWNGSHGCVNLPPSAAASLYGMVHVGDVVVVHW